MTIKYPNDEYNKYPVPSVSPSTDEQTSSVSQTTNTKVTPSVFTDKEGAVSTTNSGSIFADKKENSTANSPVSSQKTNTEVANQDSPSPAPKTAGEMTAVEIYLAKFPDIAIDDVIEMLNNKLREGSILDTEKEILEALKVEKANQEKVDKTNTVQDSKDVEDKKNEHTQYNNVKNEYDEIYSKPGTVYEKTSRVIDKYLMGNDPEYASLKPKEKRAYRDSYIASMREKLGYSKNITQAQRDIMQREIAKLVIDAAASDTPLTKSTTSSEVKTRLKSIESEETLNLQNFKLDETKSVQEQLHDIVDFILTQKDSKYKKITDPKQKQAYIDAAKGQMSEQLLKIDINTKSLTDSEREAISRLAISASKTMQKSDITTLDQLTQNSDKQNQFLAKVLTDPHNKDLLSKIENKKIKLSLEVSLAKANIYNEIKAQNPEKKVQEKDILNKLLKMDKNGGLKSNALKELHRVYTNLEKLDKELKAKNPNVRGLLDEEANLTSLASMSALAGMPPEKFIETSLCDNNGKLLTGEALQKRLIALKQIVGEGKDVPGVMILREQLLKNHSPNEVNKLLVDAGIYSKRSHIYAMANSQHSEIVNQTNAITDYGTPNQIAELKENFDISAVVIDAGGMKNIQTNLSNQAYNVYANNINTSIHTYYSQEAQDSFRNSMMESNVPAERKTSFTKSYIITGSAEQQLHDAQYFSTVKDASVTEGLAAAEKYVDASVKKQYSSYVDNAIKNNGYSADEVKNINTARETGQTSYERNAESSSTNSSQSKTETKTSTQQKTQSQATTTTSAATQTKTNKTSVTNPSVAQLNSNKATVKLSAANSNSVQQMRQTLAQLQYESSVAKKEKAMQDLQNIIDKIQNDQEVRAQKQAELKAKEAKTDEEIASAIKEAETKSADKQKSDEAKIAQEAKSSVQELNEVVETQKVENVAKKFNISVDDVKTLKEAHRQGDLNTIYTKLGSISAEAQKKFIQIISRKDTATIIGFIRNRSTDKALIKELCRLNPGLIKSLDADLLISCGLAKTDIIKYADSRQLSTMLYSLAKVGNTEQLRQFYEVLGSKTDQTRVSTSSTTPVPGDDRYFAMLNKNMSTASASATSTVVGNSRFSDGQTRQKIRPQDIDYREYLA